MNSLRSCSLCGKRFTEEDEPYRPLCNACHKLTTLVREKPHKMRQFCELTGFEDIPALQQKEQDLPEVLDAVRYRTSDRERNTWYVSVSELDGCPVEIFASTAFDRDHHLQSRISNLTTITRLISLILRHIFLGEKLTLDKTLTQLHRSSRQKNDLPEMLGNVLANYNHPENTVQTEAE